DGDGVAQADHARLGDRIAHRLRHGVEAADGAGQHHPAIAGPGHRPESGAGDVEGAEQVDVDHAAERLGGDLGEIVEAGVAGIVDEDVDPPPTVERGFDDGAA